MGTARGNQVWVTRSSFDIVLRNEDIAAHVRIAFDPATDVCGEDEQQTRYHFLKGNEPEDWTTHVRGYDRIRHVGIQPGVDLLLRFQAGHPEYDLEVAPGASLSDVTFRVEGTTSLRLDGDGSLVAQTPAGSVRQPLPRTFGVDATGHRRPIEACYVLLGESEYGIRIAESRPEERVVVDPTLVAAVGIGGSGVDQFTDIAIDQNGGLFVVGHSFSNDLPTTPGVFSPTLSGHSDVVVAKIASSNLAVQWMTFLGGSAHDQGRSVAVEPDAVDGSPTVTGWTKSADFPTTPGSFDTTANGGADLFVTKLSPLGDGLVWSTYFGGSGSEAFEGAFLPPKHIPVSVNSSGITTLATTTNSTDLPTTFQAWQASNAGSVDCFCAQFDSQGRLRWSTYLGSISADTIGGALTRSDGVAFVSASVFADAAFPLSSSSPSGPNPLGATAILLRIPSNGIGVDYAWALPAPQTVTLTGSVWATDMALSPSEAPIVTATGVIGSQPNQTIVKNYALHLDAAGNQIQFISDGGGLGSKAVAHKDGSLFLAGNSCCLTVSQPVSAFSWYGKDGGFLGVFLAGSGIHAQSIAVDDNYQAYCITRLPPLGSGLSGEDGFVSKVEFCTGQITANLDGCNPQATAPHPALTALGCSSPGHSLSFSVNPNGTDVSQSFLVVGSGMGTTPISAKCSLSISGLFPIFVPMAPLANGFDLSVTIPSTTPSGNFYLQAVTVSSAGALGTANSIRVTVAP